MKPAKIVSYCLLEESSFEGLNELVNERLREGWELYGSHHVCQTRFSEHLSVVRYTQAMVKYEEETCQDSCTK